MHRFVERKIGFWFPKDLCGRRGLSIASGGIGLLSRRLKNPSLTGSGLVYLLSPLILLVSFVLAGEGILLESSGI